MDKMEYWILLTAILSSYLCVCHQLNQNETNLYQLVENSTINEIIMKICDITINNLAHEPENKKKEILKKLEKKVKAASLGFDSVGHRYEKLILEGVKMMSENNDYKACKVDMKNLFQGNKVIVQHNNTSRNASRRTNDNNVFKKGLIEKMKQKIEKLVKKSLHNVFTPEEKQKVLNHVKEKIIEKVKLRVKNSKSNKQNVYKDLLLQGIELFEKQMDKNDSRRRSIKQVTNNDRSEEIGVPEEMYAKNSGKSETDRHTDSSTIFPVLESLTTEYSCENIVKRTCLDLLRIKEYRCSNNNSTIPFEEICDSNMDCPDGSDEKDCTALVVQRVHKATQLISTIELSAHCFSELDNSLLSRQGAMLTSLLNTEVAFIEKFSSGVTPAYNSIIGNQKPTAREMANEVAGIIKTFSVALSGSLCLNVSEVIDAVVFRFSETLDMDKEFEAPISDPKWTPKTCECREHNCANDSCVSLCQRICFQKYSLGRWGCHAISKGASVSLDLICDSKIDCYDESDETGCATDNMSAAKFEASAYFDNILKVLKTETATVELEPVRNKLILLHAAVKTIQKRSMKPKVQTKVFKDLRDECFLLLSSIFTDIVYKINNIDAIEEYYAFVMSINDKLIEALKRTHIGNKKIVSSEGCLCRGIECAMSQCSKTCIRTCAAKPTLTTYPCVHSPSSNITYVSIDSICDGKPDCPNEDDESNCKDEMCRSHHVVLLRRNVQNMDDRYKGRILGEELSSWKAKVTNYLVLFESKGRPTPKTLRQAVSDILRELLETYTSMEQFRRLNDDDVLRKLANVAKRVQDVLKSCGM